MLQGSRSPTTQTLRLELLLLVLEPCRTFEMMDAAGLSEQQSDTLRTTSIGNDGRPAAYQVIKAKLKGLFGREAKAVQNAGSNSRVDPIK